MLVLALLAVAAPIRIHVDAALFPNAAHNIACLSGRLACSKANFERFWHDDLHWTPADQSALDSWSDTLKTVAARQPDSQEIPFLANFAGWYPELVAVNKIVAAALAANSSADFRKRARGLALEEELAQLSVSLDHFRTRLEPWWIRTGHIYAETQRVAIEAQLKAREGNRQAARIAAFFESEMPTRDFYLHLIPRADTSSKDAAATFTRNHMVVELTDEMKPVGVVSIILHEMTHALYELAPAARHRQLIREFEDTPDPQAQPLYAILNEGIATAVQLNATKRAGETDDDPYHHPFIPLIGQAETKQVEDAMSSGKTIFKGFVAGYLKTASAALGPELASPRFVMTAGIVADFGLPESAAAFRTSFPMLSAAGFNDRKRFPELNIAFLLTYDKLGAVQESWPEVEPISKAHRGFVFTAPRGKKGRVYVLAGRDEKTVIELIKKLAAMRQGTPEGLIFAVD